MASLPTDATVDELYVAYKDLQARCPVAHNSDLGGFYTLTRYDTIRKAVTDWKTFSSAQGVSIPRNVAPGKLPAIEMDPPEHTPWKKLYAEAFTPHALVTLRPVLEDTANGLIDQFAARGECDLVADFAQILPILGVCKALGLAGKDPAAILQVAEDFANTVSDDRDGLFQRTGAFILSEIYDRRASPRDDYLTVIAQAKIDGRHPDDGEMIRFMLGYLVAGHETTASTLSSFLFHVLRDPALKARMLEDDEALAAGIEETVRLNAPFHSFARTTTCPVEIGDVTIPEGEPVRLMYAAANRDPAVFERPDEFDIGRPKIVHFGFGGGRHFCAGAPLARLEIQCGFRTLLARLPDIAVLDDRIDWEMAAGVLAKPRALRAVFTPGI